MAMVIALSSSLFREMYDSMCQQLNIDKDNKDMNAYIDFQDQESKSFKCLKFKALNSGRQPFALPNRYEYIEHNGRKAIDFNDKLCGKSIEKTWKKTKRRNINCHPRSQKNRLIMKC